MATELRIGKWRTTGWKATALFIAIIYGIAALPTLVAVFVLGR